MLKTLILSATIAASVFSMVPASAQAKTLSASDRAYYEQTAVFDRGAGYNWAAQQLEGSH